MSKIGFRQFHPIVQWPQANRPRLHPSSLKTTSSTVALCAGLEPARPCSHAAFREQCITNYANTAYGVGIRTWTETSNIIRLLSPFQDDSFPIRIIPTYWSPICNNLIRDVGVRRGTWTLRTLVLSQVCMPVPSYGRWYSWRDSNSQNSGSEPDTYAIPSHELIFCLLR